MDLDHARSLPQEVRSDVVRVARNREPVQKLSVLADDCGISESCLTNWMHQADVGTAAAPAGPATSPPSYAMFEGRSGSPEQASAALEIARLGGVLTRALCVSLE